MIKETDKEIIRKISKKYHAKRVLLFGSSLSSDCESHDIDIAVEGISNKDFYGYYGELICALYKPIDVVDLSGTTKFIKLIQAEGVKLYG